MFKQELITYKPTHNKTQTLNIIPHISLVLYPSLELNNNPKAKIPAQNAIIGKAKKYVILYAINPFLLFTTEKTLEIITYPLLL